MGTARSYPPARLDIAEPHVPRDPHPTGQGRDRLPRTLRLALAESVVATRHLTYLSAIAIAAAELLDTRPGGTLHYHAEQRLRHVLTTYAEGTDE